ncbi:MAG TPA: hypothetical protein VFC63_27100 [Blastocatellia bacterium]|nr:hypothetical protein [Blastocatellia bacterium]
MLIIGTRFFTWGNGSTARQWHCSACGITMPFTEKKGMRFITLFFIIPVLPISGVSNLVECPNCKTRFVAKS